MTQLNEKRTAASLHLLDLILSCSKHDAEALGHITRAFSSLLPWEPGPCASLDDSNDLVGLPIEPPAPAPVVEPAPAAPAKPAPAKKEASAAAPAASQAPAPAPETPAAPEALPEAPEALPEEPTGISQQEADRLRQLIRDTFTARSKQISAGGDPNNLKKQEYTNLFTEAVHSFGSTTVTGTDNSKLQEMLAKVSAL